MITMTSEQLEKINLLDTLFGAFDVKQLREFTEREEIAAILKGDNANSGILARLVQEHDILYNDVMMLKNDVSMMKNDFTELIKVLNSSLFTVPYSQEFQALKNKHSFY